MSKDVVFSESTPFFYAPPVSTSQENEDECLVYQVTHALKEQLNDITPSPHSSIEHQSTIVPSKPAPFVLGKPPIVQFYSRRRENNETCPVPVPSSSGIRCSRSVKEDWSSGRVNISPLAGDSLSLIVFSTPCLPT